MILLISAIVFLAVSIWCAIATPLGSSIGNIMTFSMAALFGICFTGWLIELIRCLKVGIPLW